MYFFWNTDNNDIHSYGNDSISRQVLGWNNGTKAFHTSMILATAAIFMWAVLISLPLAVGASEKKGNKMMQIKNSPLSKSSVVYVCVVLFTP